MHAQENFQSQANVLFCSSEKKHVLHKDEKQGQESHICSSKPSVV